MPLQAEVSSGSSLARMRPSPRPSNLVGGPMHIVVELRQPPRLNGASSRDGLLTRSSRKVLLSTPAADTSTTICACPQSLCRLRSAVAI
eukprot:8837310-Ditylum_brightwellii.AAC.1